MKFLDQAKVHVRAGRGGDGCVSFLRAKNRPKGGPDGGDGGRGGNVVVEAVSDLGTLIDLRYHQHWRAKKGGDGAGSNRTGANGRDLVIQVPVGTQIYAEADPDKAAAAPGDADEAGDAAIALPVDENGEVDLSADDEPEDQPPRQREEAFGALLADLVEPGQRAVIARGGKGGRGNARFKSATNQAPRQAEPGEPTEEFPIWLRLKLLADIGLVGLPNAGKSRLLATVTNARPKIADYPFTTLTPRLGVVGRGADAFVLADIPGLIAAASEGAGLGDRFLGHVERCEGLLHLVDATAEDPVQAYETVRGELAGYGQGLEAKPEWVALTKTDALDGDSLAEVTAQLEDATGAAVWPISAVAGTGLEALTRALGEAVAQARRARETPPEERTWSPV